MSPPTLAISEFNQIPVFLYGLYCNHSPFLEPVLDFGIKGRGSPYPGGSNPYDKPGLTFLIPLSG